VPALFKIMDNVTLIIVTLRNLTKLSNIISFYKVNDIKLDKINIIFDFLSKIFARIKKM